MIAKCVSQDTRHFLPLPDGLKFPPEKQNITIQDSAIAMGVRDAVIRQWLDEGLLVSFAINDKPKLRREHVRISRFSLVALWRERMLEQTGIEPPYAQDRLVLWWRNELRSRQGKAPLPS